MARRGFGSDPSPHVAARARPRDKFAPRRGVAAASLSRIHRVAHDYGVVLLAAPRAVLRDRRAAGAYRHADPRGVADVGAVGYLRHGSRAPEQHRRHGERAGGGHANKDRGPPGPTDGPRQRARPRRQPYNPCAAGRADPARGARASPSAAGAAGAHSGKCAAREEFGAPREDRASPFPSPPPIRRGQFFPIASAAFAAMPATGLHPGRVASRAGARRGGRRGVPPRHPIASSGFAALVEYMAGTGTRAAPAFFLGRLGLPPRVFCRTRRMRRRAPPSPPRASGRPARAPRCAPSCPDAPFR